MALTGTHLHQKHHQNRIQISSRPSHWSRFSQNKLARRHGIGRQSSTKFESGSGHGSPNAADKQQTANQPTATVMLFEMQEPHATIAKASHTHGFPFPRRLSGTG
jgi:hypothetical protein